MSKYTVAVDIDGVLVDSANLWHKWLGDRFEPNLEEVFKWVDEWGQLQKLPYDLTKLYTFPEGVNGKEFWNNQSLYTGMQPIEGSVEALQAIKDTGEFNIVVVSRVVGNHYESKKKWVEQHFPMIDGLILTGDRITDKTFTRCDFIIDDSLEQLQAFSHGEYRLHYQTKYVQEGVDNTGVLPVHNWGEVLPLLISLT